MRMKSLRLLTMVATLVLGTLPTFADFSEKVKGMEKQTGLLDVYLDHATGKVFLALEKSGDGTLGRYIYAPYLTAGLGSNPMGLDRSVPGGSKLLQFRRAGNRVMAVVENARFRASADNPAEKRAVRTSFAESIIWSANIEGEDETSGKVLVDLTSFLSRDGVGVAARLAYGKQGNFRIDPKRSYVDTKAAFAFPINLEFDAHLTFAGSKPGDEIDATTPEPESVSLIAHTTLMQLPDDGYQVRKSDARAGLIEAPHVDMSAPLSGDTVVRLARRFRLQKDDEGKVIKPIVFYVDNGAPEAIRSALVEGGNWWATAFEKAGFPDGFRVEVLPDGVHPLDARYNVINWVHRATRGWSYGAAVHDPRTGEVLRGVVLLGSLRVRQDIKILEGLAGTAKTGTGDADDPVELALGRIRQLSAHEIGHPLGFSHNMAASTYGGRASVMDYPAPYVLANDDDTLDFSRTYGVGVGSWDDWAVNFLYGEYDGEEKAYQEKLIAEAHANGLVFVNDGDSRNPGTGHIKGSVWDNGTNALSSLENVMKVRAIALAKFGEENLREGEAYSALQTKFVPLYLYHRYQMLAAAKYVGGYDFAYRGQGDGRPAPVAVPWEDQKRALALLLNTISPEALDVRDEVLAALMPISSGYGDPQFARESFTGASRPMFSHAVAAGTAADITLGALLHPRVLLRLAEQGVRVSDHQGLDGMLKLLIDGVMANDGDGSKRQSMLRAVVAERLTEKLIGLQDDPSIGLIVRADVRAALTRLRTAASKWRGDSRSEGAALAARIDDAFARAKTPAVKAPKGNAIPPGSPIGGGDLGVAETCWHCEPVS
ncbi:MAG: zinc-dependent metalloprotease [Kordiimonas sp.]